jgi:hypothetical protein
MEDSKKMSMSCSFDEVVVVFKEEFHCKTAQNGVPSVPTVRLRKPSRLITPYALPLPLE